MLIDYGNETFPLSILQVIEYKYFPPTLRIGLLSDEVQYFLCPQTLFSQPRSNINNIDIKLIITLLTTLLWLKKIALTKLCEHSCFVLSISTRITVSKNTI